MNETELLDVLNRFSSEGVSLSVYSYIGAAVIAFISSALGAFVTSNFKKKGEMSAINSRFDETVKQSKIQTEAVKNIEARITNQSWIDQQRWVFRKDLYLSIIELLIEAREETLKLDRMLESIRQFSFDECSDISENEQEEIWDGYFRQQLNLCHDFVSSNIDPIKQKIAVLVNKKGRLFLNYQSINILASFYNSQNTWYDKELQEQGFDINELSSPYDLPTGPTEQGELAHYSKAAKNAYRTIIKEARQDLKIDITLASES